MDIKNQRQPFRGEIVLWYAGATTQNEGHAAIVTDVSLDSVRLAVFHPGAPGIRAISWCRHISDPWNETHRRSAEEHGGWDWAMKEEPHEDLLAWTEEDNLALQPVEMTSLATKSKRKK